MLLTFSDHLRDPGRMCSIVTDSIAKYIKDIRGTTVIAFPGINVSRMTNKISNGFVDLNYRYVIFHVGTNDINTLSVQEICASYNDLISVVKEKSDCKIIMSSVLPRPIDYEVNGNKVKELNNSLQTLCKSRHVQFIKSFRPFLVGGLPRRELYAVRDGGLHLNLEGVRRLRQFFINTIAHLD